MIVTLTLNPSLDRTIEIDELARGELTRATGTRLDPGGKGVNVARALAAHGIPTRAVLPVGGSDGSLLADFLVKEGIDVRAVPVAGHTRSNVSIVEPDGTVTKLNEPGPSLSSDDLAEVVAMTVAAAKNADWVVASGSLPPGVATDFYASLGAQLDVPLAVDTSGPALAASLAGKPGLVKPNRAELAEATGCQIDTLGDAINAAAQLRTRGAGVVLVSLGADGAALINDSGVRYGESPVDRGRSSVGAGDAMLAGFLATGSLAEALAWGAAAFRLPGSGMPGPSHVHSAAVVLHDLPDVSRLLRR